MEILKIISVVCCACIPSIMFVAWRMWVATCRDLDDIQAEINATRRELRSTDSRLEVVGMTVAELLDDRPRFIRERDGRKYWSVAANCSVGPDPGASSQNPPTTDK